MQEPGNFEKYPISIVIGSNLVSLLTYGIGIYILYQISIFLAIGYVIFILLLEYRLWSSHCVNCYYYGKTCAFGKGRLSALFFPKGPIEQFNQKKMTWVDIIPDFLVFLIPFVAGVVLLYQDFTWIILILIIALFLLSFLGNALVRGGLACKYCMQRGIGCPAEKLFNKTG